MRRPAALLAAAALATAGCGETPVTEEVRAAVEGFEEASADRDVQRLCDELLARELVQRVEAAGIPCEQALRQGLSSVRSPEVEIRSVVVNGDKALAEVRSRAAGQEPSQDTIELVREAGSWRITSLAAPRPQPPRTAPLRRR